MTIASEIPSDVMTAAQGVVDGFYPDWVFSEDLAAAIARAILAERRRAAEICRDLAPATQDATSTFIGGALFHAAASIEVGACI